MSDSSPTDARTDISSIILPKWPAMVVRGDDVTQVQAKQILVRTSGFYFGGNDREFIKALYGACGITTDERGFEDWDSVYAARERYGVLELEYLTNSRIVSSYIGGPHGWCDWDGSVRCGDFNIGKCPTTGDVLSEWGTIATAFPYLRLRCQLFSGKTCEEDTRPLIEYDVRDGQVSWSEPLETLGAPMSIGETAIVTRIVSGNLGERGCTLEAFAAALALCDTLNAGA